MHLGLFICHGLKHAVNAFPNRLAHLCITAADRAVRKRHGHRRIFQNNILTMRHGICDFLAGFYRNAQFAVR